MNFSFIISLLKPIWVGKLPILPHVLWMVRVVNHEISSCDLPLRERVFTSYKLKSNKN